MKQLVVKAAQKCQYDLKNNQNIPPFPTFGGGFAVHVS